MLCRVCLSVAESKNGKWGSGTALRCFFATTWLLSFTGALSDPVLYSILQVFCDRMIGIHSLRQKHACALVCVCYPSIFKVMWESNLLFSARRESSALTLPSCWVVWADHVEAAEGRSYFVAWPDVLRERSWELLVVPGRFGVMGRLLSSWLGLWWSLIRGPARSVLHFHIAWILLGFTSRSACLCFKLRH